MPATIRDVARKAGVGVGTVSRVINSSPLVSAATRQRVLDVIAEFDYVPNPIARRLSRQETRTIGVIVPYLTNPFFVNVLHGVEAVTAESDYDLIVFNADSPAKRDRYFTKIPGSRRVDSLIIISFSPGDYDVQRLQAADVPTVLIDTCHPAFFSVYVDNVAGARLATRHLIERGHQRIAYLSDFTDDSPFSFANAHQRLLGYRQALEAAGLRFCPEYHLTAPLGEQGGYELARQVMALPQPPTGLFVYCDTMALGALKALQDLGIAIPDEVALIGFDDIEVARYVDLTTVRQPMEAMGREGAEFLLALMSDPDLEPTHIQLPLELVVRQSSVAQSLFASQEQD